MSNEEEALPTNDVSKVDAAKDCVQEPRSCEQANKLRIEMYRQVIAPTMAMIVDLFWRVLLLAAAVWLIAKYLSR